MDLKGIVSVNGLGGLFKVVNQRSDGFILSDLETNTMKFVSNRQYQVSLLEAIAIYTDNETVELKKVLESIQEKKMELPTEVNKLSNAELRKIMTDILPEHDQDRVYPSDIKKLIKWFHILNKYSHE